MDIIVLSQATSNIKPMLWYSATIIGDTSADKQEMAHPATIESCSSSNAKPDHTCMDKDGSSDQCNGNQKLSLAHRLLYLASLPHHKRDPMVPVQSCDPMKVKKCIYTDRDGSEFEQEWIEEY